ncbi:MAG: outer membrane lipoprotein carrier protein LolA [Phycisphaerae bacterium]
MRLNQKLGCAALCAALMVASGFAETLDEVTQKLEQQLKDIKSLSADMKMTVDVQQGDMKQNAVMDGKMSGTQRDGKYYSRSEATINMEMQMGEQSQKMSGNMLSVADGEFLWVVRDLGQKQIIKQKIDDLPPLGTDYVKKMKEDNELTLGENATVDGQECWVIVATPKKRDPMGPPVSKMKYYFRQSDGVIVKTEGLDEEGKVFMTMTLSNIKVNPSLSESDFKFEVPKDANVMDMTNM